jgi:hypothetical protein
MPGLYDLHRRHMMLSILAGLGGTAAAKIVPPRADTAPGVLSTNLVNATPTLWNGKQSLAIELTDAYQAKLVAAGVGPDANGPSYVTVLPEFTDGSIEVDVAAELTGRGSPDSRGFVGVAFHIDYDRTFEAIYLRMTNGSLNDPPPLAPRIDRAVQYVAHPDFHFDTSRKVAPGRYECGAKIALARWHTLRLDVAGHTCRTFVDGKETLVVDDLHYAGRPGPVALWIGNGTLGHFSNLRVVDRAG